MSLPRYYFFLQYLYFISIFYLYHPHIYLYQGSWSFSIPIMQEEIFLYVDGIIIDDLKYIIFRVRIYYW